MHIFRAVEGFPVRIYFFYREKAISKVTEFVVNQTNVLGSSDSLFRQLYGQIISVSVKGCKGFRGA